jgi:glycosyltransferase involved in cell wall biosynthesis
MIDRVEPNSHQDALAADELRGDQPRFSLVMAAHDAADTLDRAVDSVLEQTYESWELIIVDDGLEDETSALARRRAQLDARITSCSQSGRGCAAARRAGALLATGEFVTKIDADDEIVPDALERLSNAIDAEPGYDIYSILGYKVYLDGSRGEIFGDPKYAKTLSLTLEDLIDDCWIFGGLASIRRETLERVGGFRPGPRCEDYDLWLRALAQGATHRHFPHYSYLWYMDLPGHMNENPVPAFHSYIASLNDLVESGLLSDRQIALAHESIAKLEERIRQLEETGTTDADFTNAQATRFKSSANRVFGRRGGSIVIAAANRTKWIVKPIRVSLARRARLRKGR